MFHPEVWSEILERLSVRTAAAAPNLATCAQCSTTRLVFYRDSFSPTQRFWCRKCERSGDLLDLIQWLKPVPRHLAHHELQKLCPRAVIDPGTLKTLEHNAKIAKAASEANARLLGVPPKIRHAAGARTLTKALRMQLPAHLSSLDNTLGRVCGYATVEEIESNLRLRDPQKFKRPIPRQHHKFIEGNHGSALVFPLQTLPGVTTSYFLMTGTASQIETRTHLLPYSGGEVSPGFLGDMRYIADLAPLIAIPSYRLAAHMQFRWGMNSTQPCPFIGMSDDSQRLTSELQVLYRRQLTLWTMRLTPVTLQYAARLDANIAVIGPRSIQPAMVLSWIGEQEPVALSQRIAKEGRPWYEVVAKLWPQLEPHEALDLLTAARLDQSQLRQIREALSPPAREGFDRTINCQWSHQIVATSRGLVEQRDSGWYHSTGDHGELILDCPFRVEQLVYSSGTESPQYHLTAKYRGREHTLSIPQSTLESSPLTALRDAMREAGAGAITFDSSWNKLALHVAMQLHPVELVRPEPVGYNPKSEQFRFSHVKLRLRDGHQSQALDPVEGEWLARAGSEPVTRAELQALENLPTMRNALLVYVSQQIARAFGKPGLLGVCESGMDATQTRVALAILGGPAGTQPASSLAAELSSQMLLKQFDQGYRWFAGDQLLATWFAVQQPVVFLNDARPDDAAGLLSAENLQRIALELFRRKLQRGFGGELLVSVQAVWAEWLGELGATAHASAPLSVITPLAGVVQAIEFGLASGELRARTSCRQVEDGLVCYHKDSQSLLFTARTLTELWRLRGLRSIDFDRLATTLCAEPLFRGTTLYKQQPCWRLATTAFRPKYREMVREGTQRARTA